MIITPETKVFDFGGKLNYEEKTRAWTIIRLRKEIISFFPMLRNRNTKIIYKAKIFLSLKEFEEFSKKILNKEAEVPLIFYFERGNEKES